MSKTITLEEYAKSRSKRNAFLKKYGITCLFLLPFIGAFIVFFVYPLFNGIYISLTNYKLIAPGTEKFNNFTWYKMLFGAQPGFEKWSESFWAAFSHSLIFAIIMVPIAVLLPLGLAILVNKKPPGYKIFRSMIYLPSIVPLTAAGTIFTLLFMAPAQHGLLYEMFGINIMWFVDNWFTFDLFGKTIEVAYAWIPIFFMCLWGGWGGNFIILSAGLENVPKNLYEACAIDGCSGFRKTMSVTIPGIKGQLVLCLFTTIIGYLGLYGQNFVLVSGGPGIPALSGIPGGGKTSTAIYFIQDIAANNQLLRTNVYGLAAAASLVFALFVGIISGIQMFCTRERKTGKKISEAFGRWQKAR